MAQTDEEILKEVLTEFKMSNPFTKLMGKEVAEGAVRHEIFSKHTHVELMRVAMQKARAATAKEIFDEFPSLFRNGAWTIMDMFFRGETWKEFKKKYGVE